MVFLHQDITIKKQNKRDNSKSQHLHSFHGVLLTGNFCMFEVFFGASLVLTDWLFKDWLPTGWLATVGLDDAVGCDGVGVCVATVGWDVPRVCVAIIG